MTNGILFVSCGVPGSGKSTFLDEMKGPSEKIISRDAIRFSLLKPGESYFSHEREAYVKFLNEIARFIRNGFNVYADATHLTTKSRYLLLKQLHNKGCRPIETNAIYFNVPLEVCKERNENRKGTKTYVPVDKVEEMFTNYVFPTSVEGFDNIYEVDADGYVSVIYERE